jgi:hypothetical protein
MTNIDKRERLDKEVFSFREAKDGRVMLYWHDTHVKTLAGSEAQKFLKKIAGLAGKEAQLVMAKVTGNFKRGNERNSSTKTTKT